MSAALAIVRFIGYLNDASAATILGRVIEARAALPRIVEEDKDLVMVFGSSMVQAGFSARQFDRQTAERGATAKSFNFGFGGLNPLFQDYLSRRIGEAFDDGDRRLKLAVLEFNPFQTTTSRYNGAVPVIDSFVTMLATPEEMWEILLDDPTRGILLLNIHYLRGGISAQMATNFFARPLRAPRPRSDLPEDEEAAERRQQLGEQLTAQFEKDYPDYSGENWHYGWQGAGTIPEERSAETHELFRQYYQSLRTPRRLDNDRIQRSTCCDIIEMHFEPVLVEAYIRIIKNFQQFSDRVEVIMLPRNTAWIQYPPEARARLQTVLDRIEKETGVKVQDFQTLDMITPEMFSDTTHLSRYAGDVAFTGFLVERYSEYLRQP
jgi:hypothetical protein